MMLFSLSSELLFCLVVWILLYVLVELGLVVSDVLFVVLALLDQVFALGLDFANEVLLFLYHLLVGFLQVLDSLFQQLVFFEKLFILLLLCLNWLDLFCQFSVFLLKFGQFCLGHVCALNFDDLVVFFALSFDLLLQGLNLSLEVAHLELVTVFTLGCLLDWLAVFFLKVFKFFA